MPLSYQQNKKHVYKWAENNKEQHLKHVKNYYQKKGENYYEFNVKILFRKSVLFVVFNLHQFI